ncbi:Fe-S cluster assembly protein SufD [Candidatus Poriferisodalis sp.]|uniref:Fe-S cluster assembly protein SufD n=1 Tax=Candidatus Poriferisodalis sp. TaxID=3101277 RepID=UPI003B023B68
MFSPDLVSALGGSDTFAKRRRRAAERAVATGMPSFTDEVWRYTPIDDLDADLYRFGAPGGAAGPAGLMNCVDSDAAAVVHISNGVVVDVAVRAAGVRISTLDDGADEQIGMVAPEGPDVFGDWNLALTAAPIALCIDPKAVIAAPIVVHVHTDAEGLAWFPRLVVTAGHTSQATVVEHHSSGATPALICPLTELSVADGAHLAHVTVQELGPAAWQIANLCSEVGRDANLRIGHVAMGGAYARARIGTDMAGRGGHSEIDAVYFGRGTSTLDFRTFQTHIAPHTTSDLLFKGAVDDHARAVYTGLIRIESDASHVVAEQTNRNLKLSPHAWAESVPNLEIENNDVQCSHASSIGPVDADQRFYLESRGVPTDVAEALVVRGFFDEVLDALPSEQISASVRRRIDELVSDSDFAVSTQ